MHAFAQSMPLEMKKATKILFKKNAKRRFDTNKEWAVVQRVVFKDCVLATDIRSARCLETECQRNIEVMWLMN